MKKVPFILFSLVLGLIILAGCGEWLAKREAKRDEAKKRAEVNTLSKNDAAPSPRLVPPHCKDTTVSSINDLIKEKPHNYKAGTRPPTPLPPYYYVSHSFHYLLDTNKTKKLEGHADMNIWANCRKHIFGFPDEYVFEHPKDNVRRPVGNSSYIAYYNGIEMPNNITFDYYNRDDKKLLRSIHISRLDIKFDTATTLSVKEAVALMYKAVPVKEFRWQNYTDSLCYKGYLKDSTGHFRLCYRSNVYGKHSKSWLVSIDANTGNVVEVLNGYSHLCEVADNSTSQATIEVDISDFGYGTNQDIMVQYCDDDGGGAGCPPIYRLTQHAPFVSAKYSIPDNKFQHIDWMPNGNMVPNLSISTNAANSTATVNGILFSDLASGLNYVDVSIDDCSYNVAVALAAGNLSGVTATPMPTACSGVSDILLSLPVGEQYDVAISSGGNYTDNQVLTGNSTAISLQEKFSIGGSYAYYNAIEAGNYAILVRRLSDGATSAFHLSLPLPDCTTYQTRANTAYWSFLTTHNALSETIPAYGSMPPITLPMNVFTQSINSSADPFLLNLGIAQNYDEVNPLCVGPDCVGGSINLNIVNNWLSLDAIAHEYIHGVDRYERRLSGVGEAGILEEGFCDIFGILVEGSKKEIDWIVGNSFATSTIDIRNIQDPNASAKPKTYYHTTDPFFAANPPNHWFSNTDNNIAYTHRNSTVLGHWFYLLAMGGNGTNDYGWNYNCGTAGIGIDKAAQIAYDVLTIDMPEPGGDDPQNFYTFRDKALGRVEEINTSNGGACSADYLAVLNALYAIGLPYFNTDAESATCDYHLPYVSQVVVRENGVEKYNKKWEWTTNFTRLCLEEVIPTQPINFSTLIQLEAHSSEEMSFLNFDGVLVGGILYDDFSITSTTADSKIWGFEVSLNAGATLPTGEATLQFSGQDLAGNNLIKLQDATIVDTDCIMVNEIPLKSTTGNWITAPNTEFDRIHKMNMACTESDPDTDICDNHLPYLQSLTIVEENEGEISHQEWVDDGSSLCLTNDYPSGYINLDMGQNLILTVVASEPLQILELERIALGSIVYDISSGTPLMQISVTNNNNTEWTFTLQRTGELISNNYFEDGSNDYHFYFIGSDFAGNSLEVLQNYPSYNPTTKCISVSDIPIRTETGSWSAQYSGMDSAFSLGIDYCEQSYGNLFNWTTEPTPISIPPNALYFQPATGSELPTSYTVYDNETGMPVEGLVNIAITNPADQTYNVDEELNIAAADFATLGAIPSNYTIVITMSNDCKKVISGSIPAPNCIIGSQDITYTSATVEGHSEYSFIYPQLNLENCPCTIVFSNGSIGYTSIEVAEYGTYTLNFPLLSAEKDMVIPYSITNTSGCIAYGVLIEGIPTYIDYPTSSTTTCPYPLEFTADITPAIYNCKGVQVKPGSAYITANCAISYGVTPNLSNLNSGIHTATIEYGGNNYYLTFNIPAETIEPEWIITADVAPAYTPCTYPDEGQILFLQYDMFASATGYTTTGTADLWVWGDGFTSFQKSRSSLLAHPYTVTIIDTITGCSAVRSYDLSAPSNPGYHAQVTPALTDCAGNVLQNGRAEIMSESLCPMTFRVYYNGAEYPTGEMENLEPGNYTVQISTDFYSDYESTDPFVTHENLTFSVGSIVGVQWLVAPVVTPSAQNCTGDSQTGGIDLSDTQLVFPNGTVSTNISYNWGAACPAPCHDAVISGLSAGSYEVVLTEAGCTYIAEITVPAGNIDYQFTAYDITPAYTDCNGNLLVPGSARIAPAASCGAGLAYTIADETANHTLFNLQPGSNLITITHSGISETISIEIPVLDISGGIWKDEVAISPSTLYQCSEDNCTGSINIEKVTLHLDNYGLYTDTYSWADCPTCNSATRNNLCAGTYTVTASNGTSGCWAVFSYTVTTSVSQEVICCVESQSYPAYPTEYPDIFSPLRAAYLLPIGSTTWTSDDNTMVNEYDLPSGTTLTLNTDLVVPDGAVLTLDNITIAFAPHSRLLVQRGGVLYLGNNVHLEGLCNAMWQGIQVEGPGQDMAGSFGAVYSMGTNIQITDAIIGIAGMNIGEMNTDAIATLLAPTTSTVASGSAAVITATPVSTNGAGLLLNMSSLTLPYLWGDICRQTAGGLIDAQNIHFERCLQGINISWQYSDQNQISHNSFISNNLRYPFNQTATPSETGIYGLSVKQVTVSPVEDCTFEGCKYGVRFNDVSNAYLTGCQFTQNQIGISARGFLSSVAEGISLWANTFDNCRIALQADGIDQLHFRNNQINPAGDSEGLYGNGGSVGIYARGCNSLLQNNTIKRVRFGLILRESEYEGTFVHGNIIEDTREAILSEGNNKSCHLVCNHLLFYDKAGLDIRAASGSSSSVGVLAPQGDCYSEQPAANTFMPDNAIDILLGANTQSLSYSDVTADLLTFYRLDDSTSGQYLPQSTGCLDLSLTDYCEGLRLTSLADIDQLPVGSLNFDKEVSAWLFKLWESGNYEEVIALLHRYGNNTFTPVDSKMLTRLMIVHKISQDSVSTAKTLLTQWTPQQEEDLRYKQFYNLLADLAESGRTIWQLTATETALLQDIAQSPTKTAYKAQGLCYKISGSEYVVQLPPLADGTPTDNWYTTFKTNPQPQISDIWPNPTQSEAQLRYTLPAQTTARFALYDLTGRLLQTATLSGNGQYSIAVGQYPAGMYLYEVLDAKSTLVLKRGKLLVVK